MLKGALLVSVAVSAREVADAASGRDAAHPDGDGVTPLACLSMDRGAVSANSVGDPTPPLSEQLARMQSHYQQHVADDVADSALLHIRLGDTGPREEVLGYYESIPSPGNAEAEVAAPPPSSVASLFSCPEVVYLQDPPPSTDHSPLRAHDSAANLLRARQRGHRWQSVFRAPLTIVDDRYGATSFWYCLQEILYKGAFGFDDVEGERYGVQLQGIAVPAVEVDENYDEAEGADGASERDQPAAVAVALHEEEEDGRRGGKGNVRAAGAEAASFDLFYFFSNVQRLPEQDTEQDSGKEGDTPQCGRRRAAKCHVADAQDLRDVTQYLESFVAQIEQREGPSHLIFYITFVDANDTGNCRSLCLVRLVDVPLSQKLSPNEFRVAEVLEMLVEELALALNAGADPRTVFEEDEGVQLALGCGRLTMVLRKVLCRNYERFARNAVREGSDFVTPVHWLFNLPDGEVGGNALDDGTVLRVRYNDPTSAARMNLAMELMVELQEVNMECALPSPQAQPGVTETDAALPLPRDEEGGERPSELPALDDVETEEVLCAVVDGFSPSYRGATSPAAHRRRSVVCSTEWNTAVASASPFVFPAVGEGQREANPSADFPVSEDMWHAALLCEGGNHDPLTDYEGTMRESAGFVGRHTRLAQCRIRSRATIFMEATPMTLHIPVMETDTGGGLPNLFHVQMQIGAQPPPRKRRSVHHIRDMFHANRLRRRQRREHLVFSLV